MSNGQITMWSHNGSLPVSGCIAAMEPRLTGHELDLLLAHHLRLPAFFAAAAQQVKRDHFVAGLEDQYAVLWATAMEMSAGGRPVTCQSLWYELHPRLDQANPSTAPLREQLLSPQGLIHRVAAMPDDQLSETTGRQLLQRFLVERQVINATPRLQLVSDAEFAQRTPHIDWLVRHVIARGQPCVFGGPSKALKTSLMLDLAISIGSNPPASFLDFPAFSATAGSVLIYSAESGEASLNDTRRRIMAAKRRDGRVNITWCFDAPRLSDRNDLDMIRRHLEQRRVDVVFFDPIYLMMLSGSTDVSAANLFQTGPLMANITRTCLNAGATPVFVAHFNRPASISNDPPTLEDLAFAGPTQFCRQWILVNRRERYEDGSGEHRLRLACGGSAGHSGLWEVNVSEGRLDDPGGRHWSVQVRDPGDQRTADHVRRATGRRARQH
jgi:hypothetical protein